MARLSIPSVMVRHSCLTVLMLMLAFVLVASGQEPANANAVLRRTRERLLAELARMPRYTCLQTIKRQYFRPRANKRAHTTLMLDDQKNQTGKLVLRSWDRVRLEVAILEGKNVYSWVGAPRFGGHTLEQFAEGGPLASGDFGPFLTSIFESATIIFKSEELAGQKRLFTYSYEMPLERSGYSIKCNQRWVRTAYNGRLVIDPETSDIVNLTVRSAAPPGSSSACQAASEVKYGRTQIHDTLVLIPRQTRLITVDNYGSETKSLTAYSSCREYASTVRFVYGNTPAVTATSTVPAPQSPPSSLPAGLHFRARIVTPIDSDTAAAGDPIEAVLLSPIHGKHGREWAPAGSRLHARLLRMAQSMSPKFFQVMVEFESIELKGREVPLQAATDLSGFSVTTIGAKPAVSVIPDVATGKNVFIFREQHLFLKKFDWNWTTVQEHLDQPEHQEQPSAFPAGLHFRARILTPFDSDTSVIGEQIEGVLLSPIRGKDGSQLAPAGARLDGHLLALKRYTLKGHYYIEVLVRFEFVELDGSAVPLRATPDMDVFGDGPYGEDMLVIRDDRMGEDIFLFSMQHVHLENLTWGWTTVPTQHPSPQNSPKPFPAGLHLRARIVTPIDSDTAGAGDPIEVVLLSPIRGNDGRELAPAGARLHGQLLGLKQLKGNADIIEIVIQLQSIELNGGDVPLLASPDLAQMNRIQTAAGPYRPELSIVPNALMGMNLFIFRKEHLHLENFDWSWTTLAASSLPQTMSSGN